ncbi:MAG: hypothetical protein PHQ86_06005 [Dehalococcoidales bacterium]|nr:hypothetical protein [Dehalococcoidales bacterium]
MRKLTIFIVMSLILILGTIPVFAADMPPLPHAFYGSVTINGSAAPIGTLVEAVAEGIITGTYNPIISTEQGKYGSSDPLGTKLIVKGDIEEAATITFYVNGLAATQSYLFDSGETTELDLSLIVSAGPSLTPEVVVNLFGTKESLPISADGKIEETIQATSADGMLTLTIPEGTIALDEKGEPITVLTSEVDTSPPPPPEESHIIGLTYNFGPARATFSPPITMVYSYDPNTLPEGVSEADLTLAYYDEVTREWIELECIVNTDNNTVTASVSHFTEFAIIGAVKPVESGEVITPPAAEEAEKEEVIAPPAAEEAEKEEVITAEPSETNWLMVAGITGGAIVIFGLIIFIFVRRRPY